ncbi:hypothetical protein BC826DRAFT_1050478 [Russula brevipes]|nr:hypothetical protein BC826DRAFT_1050478 [Russula brevipes]
MHGCTPLDRDLPYVANYSRTGPYPAMVLLPLAPALFSHPSADPLPLSLLVTPEASHSTATPCVTGFPRSVQGAGINRVLATRPPSVMVFPPLVLPPRSHPSAVICPIVAPWYSGGVHSTATSPATSLRMSCNAQEPGFVKWSSPNPIQRWYSIRWCRHRLRARMRAAPTLAPLRFCLPISPV